MALLLGAALWHGLRPIIDLDLWWHMRLGEQLLATHSLIDRDPFSFTFADHPWPYKDAGWAVLVWGLWSVGGSAAIVIAKATLLVATLGLAWFHLARQRCLPMAAAVVGTAIIGEAIAFRFTERGASVGLTLMLAVVVLVHRDRAGHGGLPWAIALVAILANLHRSALLLPIVLAGHAATRSVEHLLGAPDTRWRRAWIIAIAGSLATLATPFGTAILTTTHTLVDEHAALMTEWAPVSWPLVRELTPASVLTAALAVTAVVLGMVQRPRNWWDIALGLGGLALGSQALRHLPYLAVLGAAPGMSALARWPSAWTGRLRHVIAVSAATAALLLQVMSPLPSPSLGLTPAHFPERGVAFIRNQAPATRLRGHLIHEFAFGGFLIFHLWPQVRAYVDGRTDLVYPAAFVARHAAALANPDVFAREVERWDLQWVWLDNAPFRSTRVFLDRDPRWALVHVSRRSLVYVRRDGINAALAETGYRWLWPHDLGGSLARAQAAGALAEALSELQRMIREDPDNPYPRALLDRVDARRLGDHSSR